MSSLDNITTESIQCLTFGDSYTKKSGTYLNEFFEYLPPRNVLHHTTWCPRPSSASRSRSKRSSVIKSYIYYYVINSLYNFRIFLYSLVSDPSNFPTLWIGTSVGSVLTIMINLPPSGEPRTTQPVTVAPCGEFFPSLSLSHTHTRLPQPIPVR